MIKKTSLLFAILVLIFSSCAREETQTAAKPVVSESPSRIDNYKIGVILPLTGKYSIYGESTLHGIECAAGIYSPCESKIKAQLIIKDDAGLADRAVLAVEDLVKNEHVSVIIGPLSSASIEAAAKKAQELGVPLISLSQREGISQIGDNIFSVALTAQSQVNEIVNYAVKVKKLKSFAVVYPMTASGETYKNLFTNAIAKTNGKIVFSEAYGETTLDFGSIFRKQKQKFDAIFLPDSYRAVGYITSTMLLEGFEGVQLLGISRWNNSELIERGGDALQGAVFVDGFFDSGKEAEVQRFVSSFNQVYKINPTILEAQGYDACTLASKALLSTGGAHPLDVKNALMTQPETEGATGQIGFDSNREIIRRLFLLTVKESNIVELQNPNFTPIKRDKYGTPIPQETTP